MLIDSEVMDGPAAFSTGSSAKRQQVCVLGDVVDERSPPVDRGEVIVSLDREVRPEARLGGWARCHPY